MDTIPPRYNVCIEHAFLSQNEVYCIYPLGRSLPYLKIFPECFFLMDLASLMAVSVVTVACSMLSLLLVNDKHGICIPTNPRVLKDIRAYSVTGLN